jgi:TPR repeat protein
MYSRADDKMNIAEFGRKAAAGSCAAQSVLGGCCLIGLDVEVNYPEAFKLLSAAANQGSSRAQDRPPASHHI